MKHNGGPLDAEKHSMGLRNGNTVERAAYAALLDVFKLQMIIRPYLVYWNPYNVTLKNANPGLGFNMGNSRGRFENGSLHLPDATIETSNGLSHSNSLKTASTGRKPTDSSSPLHTVHAS